MAILSAYHLTTLSAFLLEETGSRAELLSRALFQRAFDVVREHPSNSHAALRSDGGIRSILEASIGYSENVTYAAIVDSNGIAIAHAFPSRQGLPVPEQPDFNDIAGHAISAAARTRPDVRVRQPLLAGDQQFTMRIGVSPLLVRAELRSALQRAVTIVLGALLISSLVAMLLAQWLLRPIHVIQSSLSRLGRGELDVRLDLQETEFKDLGSSFEAVSAQLAAVGRGAPPQDGYAAGCGVPIESVMENLEDAVALSRRERGELHQRGRCARCASRICQPRIPRGSWWRARSPPPVVGTGVVGITAARNGGRRVDAPELARAMAQGRDTRTERCSCSRHRGHQTAGFSARCWSRGTSAIGIRSTPR